MAEGPEITRTGPGDDGMVDLPRGASVGRYVILDLVGEGGMGVVYAAYDPELDRKLALKLLRASSGSRAARRKTRLIREAQAMARLSHRNVITVHDVGSIEDRVFVAMEFIEGGSVGEWIKEPRPWQKVVEIFVEAGEGLAAAHRAGLVHRDFKPDNVMLAERGRVVVTDFGLARAADGSEASGDSDPSDTKAGKLSTTVTAAGAIMGTPAYMAPEQHDARRVDARSDQFAFAVALYECLYGERPFPGDDVASLAYHVTSGNVRAAPPRSPVPTWVRNVLLRALSVDPSLRYATMEALLSDLVADRTVRPRWGGVLIGVGAAAAIGVGAGFLLDPEETPCAGGSIRVDAVLGRAALDRARVGFIGTELPYATEQWPAVEAALKRYGETWDAAYVRVCEATRLHAEQSQLLLDVRMECLTHRLDDAAALVALLGQGDPAAVEHGLEAAQSLPPPSACETTGVAGGGAPLPEPDVAAEVEALRPQLARVAALERAGVFTVGLEAARNLVLEAEEIDYPPLQAEAYLRLASLQRAAKRWDVAERNYKEALTRALRGRADDVASEASVALVGVVARDAARASEAEGWAAVADALLERTQSEPAVRAELLTRRAQLLEATGRLEEARPQWSEAILLLSGAYGEDDVRVADASAGLGRLQFRLGEPAAARPLLERALELTEYNVGIDHPKTAELMHALGGVELALGDHASALEHLRNALSVRDGHDDVPGSVATMRLLARSHAMGGDHDAAWDMLDAATKLAEVPALHAELQADLARTALARGDWSLALSKARRARAQLQELPEATVPAIAAVDTMIGRALLELRRYDDARSRARRAITAVESDPKRLDAIGEPLSVLGEAWLAQDAPEKAIGPLERALPLLEGKGPEVARAKFALARALVASGGSTSRAHDLAEEAAKAADPDSELATAIGAWLETQ